MALFFCVWCGAPSPSLWQVLALAGGVGFATAIGVHPLIGYTDFSHLAPAFVGLGLCVAGLWLSYPSMHGSPRQQSPYYPDELRRAVSA
ncbi:MAG: hypothetical protein ACRYG7_37220 [Janthinobacterium lividum]